MSYPSRPPTLPPLERQARRRCANRPGADRHGGIFLELIIGCGLLALLLAATAQTTVLFLRQQRTVSQHASAAREAENLLDRASSLPFAQLTPDKLQSTLPLSQTARTQLPGAEAEWQVVEDPLDEKQTGSDEDPATDEAKPNGPRGRQVTVRITWGSKIPETYALSMWRYETLPAARTADAEGGGR